MNLTWSSQQLQKMHLQISTPSQNKYSQQNKEQKFFILISSFYQELTLTSYLKVKDQSFSFKIRNKTKILSLSLPPDIVLELFTRAIRQEKKGHQNWKRRRKNIFYSQMTITLYTENSKEYTHNIYTQTIRVKKYQ